MDTRKTMLILGAVIVAAVVAFVAFTLIRGSEPEPEPVVAEGPVEPPPPMVLVATRELSSGTMLDAGAMRYQEWPGDLVDPSYYEQATTDIQSLIGSVARFSVTAGEPITRGVLVHPGERGFLAAALTPGMRAVTVRVSNPANAPNFSGAGFIFPGDRVDVVLTQNKPTTRNALYLEDQLFTAETVVEDIRVLATDQRHTVTPDPESGQVAPVQFLSVTLEATAKIAEKLAVAQQMGDLSLSLRPLADNKEELEAAIALGSVEGADGEDVERTAILNRHPAPTSRLSGSPTTGGNVSRFWEPNNGSPVLVTRGGRTGPAQTSPPTVAR